MAELSSDNPPTFAVTQRQAHGLPLPRLAKDTKTLRAGAKRKS
jgi:hypothetical protein